MTARGRPVRPALVGSPAAAALAAAALAAAAASARTPGVDAWPLVDKGARIAAAVAPSPLLARVRSMHRGALGLDDEDVAESLDAARAYGPALDALDAAGVAPACTLPKALDGAGVEALADGALVVALADAADKKPARAAAGVGRAADLAGLVAACGKPSLSSAALAVHIGARARAVAWFLAEQRLVDAGRLQRMAAALERSAQPALMVRALDGERVRTGRPAAGKAVEDTGKELDAAARDQTALREAAADFEHIPRVARAVRVKCDATGDDARFTVTRAVAHTLEHRGADALAADSVVGPSLDGAGVIIVSAGPIARSCGFHDGDIVVEVNGLSVGRVDEAAVQAPARVAKDGYAAFRVLRFGSAVSWRVEVEKLAP